MSKMKYSALVYIALQLLFVACNSDQTQTTLNNTQYLVNPLNADEQFEFKNEIVKYFGKSPVKFVDANQHQLDSLFKEHYKKENQKHTLEFYYVQNDTINFLLTRIAPSRMLKKVALGGRMVKNQNGEITFYQEVFRTWKHPEEDLKPIMEMLFPKMVRGEDLSMYYPENSGDEWIIEFPDSENYYDTEKRRWISTRENPLEKFYEKKVEVLKSKGQIQKTNEVTDY